MGAVAAAAIVRKETEIIGLFRAAGATAADKASTLATLGVHEGVAYRRLRGHAVLRETPDGRLYVDLPRWEALQRFRRRLAFTLMAIVLIGGLIALVLSSGR